MENDKIILGYTDEVTECDCCGKINLKGTYAVSLNGNINYFGSVCAFKVHAVTDEEKEVAIKEFKEKKIRLKAIDKLNKMKEAYNGTDHSLVKMLRFVEAKKMDLVSFIKEYGKVCDENDFYTAYAVGHVVKTINK